MANRLPAVGRLALIADAQRAGKLIGDFTIGRLRRGQVPARLLLCRRRAIISAGSSGICRRMASFAAPPRWTIPGCRSPGRSRAICCKGSPPRRCLERGVPVPHVPQDGRRHDPGPGRTRHLHRRTRLRNLGAPGISARAARRSCSSAGEPLGLVQFGMPRVGVSAAGEELRHLGRANTGRSTVRTRPGSAVSSIFARTISSAVRRPRGKADRRQAAAGDLRGRGGRRRRDRRRADLARRQRRRLGHLGRLSAIASASRWRWAISRRTHAEAEAGFEIEIIGERRPAVRLAAPAYDPAGAAMRS